MYNKWEDPFLAFDGCICQYNIEQSKRGFLFLFGELFIKIIDEGRKIEMMHKGGTSFVDGCERDD